MKEYLYGKPLITPYNPKMDVYTDMAIQQLLTETIWEDEDEMQEARDIVETYYNIIEEDGEIKIRNKTDKEKILTEITDFCRECPSHLNCPEEDCVLFRIEQIVEDVSNSKEND